MASRSKGFTLIELIITIAVLGVVISLAAPSFNSLIRNTKSTTLTGEFVAALNFARTEAIKRGRNISICPSLDKISCATKDDWTKGWIVAIDDATSITAAAPVITSADTSVLRYWEAQNHGATITFAAAGTIAAANVKTGKALVVPATTATNFVRFTSMGTLARIGNNSLLSFKAAVKDCGNFNAAVVSISLSGLITTTFIKC